MAKFVSIGDSLTQGFQSCAISRTDQSYPAIIAKCLGLNQTSFLQANFYGEGGFPLNIEQVARNFQQAYGDNLDFFEWFSAPSNLISYMDKVEDYWERGPGSQPSANLLYHNLAYFGATIEAP